jgi:hypothetical protein
VTEAGLADIEASCRAPREGDRSAAAAAPLWGAARERGSRQNFRLQQGVLDTTVTLRRDDAREERFWIVGEDEAEPTRGTALPSVQPADGPGESGSDRRPRRGMKG